MEIWSSNLAVTIICVVAVTVQSGSKEGALLKSLLANYSSLVRPVVDSDDTVRVNVTLEYRHLVNLNEKEEVLSSIVWIGATWTDEFMKWDQNKTGIDNLVAPIDLVWHPDLYISNMADEPKNMIVPILGHKETALFFSNGTIISYNHLRVETHCKMVIKKFPFDNQDCKIQIGSWAYQLNELELHLFEPSGQDMSGEHFTSSSWEVMSIIPNYKYIQFETFDVIVHQNDIEFNLSLRRKPSAYVAYIIVPGLMLDVVVLATFLLPIRSGERINVCLTSFLAYSFQLLILSDKLPEAGDGGPDIAYTFLYSMGLTLVAIIWSIVESRIDLQSSSYGPPPTWLLKAAQLLHHCEAPIKKNPNPSNKEEPEDSDPAEENVCTSQCDPSENKSKSLPENDGSVEEDNRSATVRNNYSDDWYLIMMGIDKILLLIIFLQMFITNATFFAKVMV